jgi:hypothetical protein
MAARSGPRGLLGLQASITGGILGVLLGAAFLIAACLHWKSSAQIQNEFRVEEVPAAEIVSQM